MNSRRSSITFALATTILCGANTWADSLDEAKELEPRQVIYSVKLFEDPQDSFCNVRERNDGNGVVIQDSQFFGDVLKIMQKNRLVKVLCDPSLVTLSGQEGKLKIGGPDETGTLVQVMPTVHEGKIRTEMRVRIAEQRDSGQKVTEVDTGFDLAPGQTILIGGDQKIETQGTRSEAVPGKHRNIYLAVTADWVE